jgi:hypothetical protein
MFPAAVARYAAVCIVDGCVRNDEQAGGIMMAKRQKATFECNENVLMYLQNELWTSVTRAQVCASAETWYSVSAINVKTEHAKEAKLLRTTTTLRSKRYRYVEWFRGKQSSLQVLQSAVVPVVAKPAACEHNYEPSSVLSVSVSSASIRLSGAVCRCSTSI